jgi:hypothetical protein
MDIITIESEAYKNLVSKINTIAKFVIDIKARDEEKNNSDDIDGWVDSYEVCTFLKISGRTLQRLRASHLISFSLIRGKAYYKVSEIQRLMNENVIRCSDECMQELIKNHTLYVEHRRNTKSDR